MNKIIEIASDSEDNTLHLASTSQSAKQAKSPEQHAPHHLSTSAGMLTFTLCQILENLHILGMNSLESWEKVIDKIKSNAEIWNDPFLTQICYCLQQFYHTFYCHVHLNADLSQEKIESFTTLALDFDDLLQIWHPVLNKKQFSGKQFSFDAIQKLTRIIKSILFESSKNEELDKTNESQLNSILDSKFHAKMEKSCKRKHESKSRKFKKSKKYAPSSNSSSSDSSDSEAEDNFAKFFSKKKNQPLYISQQFMYSNGDVRKRMTTPGEEGGYLVKIEISDTKDLKHCKNEKFYWQKVSKKGYFLLDTNKSEDSSILENLTEILAKVAERVSEIKNTKFETFSTDPRK